MLQGSNCHFHQDSLLLEAVLQHFAVARGTEKDPRRLKSNFEKSGEESEEEIEGFMLEACSRRFFSEVLQGF